MKYELTIDSNFVGKWKACCDDKFDRDELGLDPEDDQDDEHDDCDDDGDD